MVSGQNFNPNQRMTDTTPPRPKDGRHPVLVGETMGSIWPVKKATTFQHTALAAQGRHVLGAKSHPPIGRQELSRILPGTFSSSEAVSTESSVSVPELGEEGQSAWTSGSAPSEPHAVGKVWCLKQRVHLA